MHVRYLLPLLLLLTSVHAQESVRLEAADGQPLHGAYHAPSGSPRGGVVLLHMYRSNGTAWRPIAGRLREAGFHVLALDLRGHGRSTQDAAGEVVDVSRQRTADPATNPFLEMHQDAKAGIDLLIARGAPRDRIGVLGASVGCSVALHLGQVEPESFCAAVFLSPGPAYLGLPSIKHAKEWGARPILMLSAAEEASTGLDPLKEVIKGDHVESRVIPKRGIHGTRMLGAVTAIEADIIDWLSEAMARTLTLEVPVTKDLFIDGKIEADEGAAATRLSIPLSKERTATVRVSRNRKKLVVGFDVPERYLRQNAVAVYVHGEAAPSPGPSPRSFRISYSPADPQRKPLLQWQGDENGAWQEVPARDLQAYGDVRDRKRWTAEIAIPLSKVMPEDGSGKIRLAFQINGQKAGSESFFPAAQGLMNLPRLWVPSHIQAL